MVVRSLVVVALVACGPQVARTSAALAQERTGAPRTANPQSEADTIRQRVKAGQKVRITDDRGREWRGRIGGFATDDLTLLTDDRQRRDIPYREILRIDRPHDSLANGALIGFASGAFVGLLAVIAEETAECEPVFFTCGDPTAAAYLVVPGLFGGLGAGVGVGIDALIRKSPNLYRRNDSSSVTLGPVLSPRVAGVTVRVRW